MEVKKKKSCKNCAYFYVTTAKVEKVYYNALLEKYDSEFPVEERNACGFSPGGILLDDDQRFCGNYEEA